MESTPSPQRRQLLTAVLGGMVALVGGGLGILAGVFTTSSARASRQTRRSWVAVCKLSDLSRDEPRAATLRFRRLDGWYWQEVRRSVYVRREESGGVRVFSRRCTHLGCPIRWSDVSRNFLCRCHGGVFDAEGAVIGGPPPRPLDELPHRIVGDIVEVEKA